jgi:hypothetical protein
MFEQAGEKLRAPEDLHHSLTERDQVSEIKIRNSKLCLTSTRSDEVVSLLGSSLTFPLHTYSRNSTRLISANSALCSALHSLSHSRLTPTPTHTRTHTLTLHNHSRSAHSDELVSLLGSHPLSQTTRFLTTQLS